MPGIPLDNLLYSRTTPPARQRHQQRRDRPDFEIPIDLYFDPLNSVELFRYLEKLLRSSILVVVSFADEAQPTWNRTLEKLGANLRRSSLSSRSFQLIYPKVDRER